MSRAIVDADQSVVDELRAIIEKILPLDAERAGRWRLWLAVRGRAIGAEELSAMQLARQEELVARLSAALGRRDPTAPEAARTLAARRLVALLDGVSVQAVFAPNEWPPDEQLAHFDHVLSL